MDKDKDIAFVARRYRRGRFVVDKGWKHLGLAPSSRWRRIHIAAAIGGVVFLSAAAAMIYHSYNVGSAPEMEINQVETVSPTQVVRIIDFENAPLPAVIERIREVYGVEVANVPEDASSYVLSLHYEGNAADLIDTINDILDTQMTVEE